MERFHHLSKEIGLRKIPKEAQVGPGSSKWTTRVKLEMEMITKYLEYLQQENQNLWFMLAPSRDKKHKFRIWEGKLKIPRRPDVSMDFIVLLPTEYPNVFPRAFIEDSAIEIAAQKIYYTTKFEHNNKTYVMICHDHMDEHSVWDPSFTIAHFLLDEILIWWNSVIDTVLRNWDQK